jgi:hypothetical protein
MIQTSRFQQEVLKTSRKRKDPAARTQNKENFREKRSKQIVHAESGSDPYCGSPFTGIRDPDLWSDPNPCQCPIQLLTRVAKIDISKYKN